MGKINAFDVLKRMNELDAQEIEKEGAPRNGGRLALCNQITYTQSSKKGDLITVGTPSGTMQKVTSLFEKATHRIVLLVIHNDEYEQIEKELEKLAVSTPQPHDE